MLQTYEALYSDNQFRWLNQAPPKLDREVHVVLVMDIEKTTAKPKKNLHDVLQRAWGCLGTGKSLDEIDAEMNAMRQDWDRGWD
ncbi:MAG: hypothetical protein VSS75_018365 [Candidatus Parabeggiatoa sp.]|nr:hypothetical protein [Candidatus Parabeggiatoa sp.]